jgi:release factor glutamine methyltransferase
VVLARELPVAEVYALDASREALAVAAENAQRHGVERRLALRCGDLLTPLHDYVDCVVANLPYVTTGEWSGLQPEVREHEPRQALDGGEDGLDLIRALLRQAPRYLLPGGFVALEIGEEQAEALGRFVEESLPRSAWRVEKDFADKDRYFFVRPRT